MKNKTVLVTGGAGAIGANLVNTLLPGNKVIVIDDLSSGDRSNINDSGNLSFYNGSITDDKILDRIFLSGKHKIDVVFHMAAHFANQNSIDHPQADLLTNALGTLKLLEFSKIAKVGKFVYTSSSCVYGGKKCNLTEDLFFKLETPYAISKLSGEEYVHFYHNFHKLNTVVIRYFNAFGPGDPPGKYRNVIPNFMKLAINNQPLIITGTGDETRDFTYMDDVVRGTILAAQSKNAIGEILNIGAGKEIKIKYMAELINRISANKAGIRFVKRRKWDGITRRVADISKAKRLIGYYPKVSFEDGIKRTFLWFKEKYS